MKNVSVAYSGVHQAYQIAQAAQENGVLDTFYCSIMTGKIVRDRLIDRVVKPSFLLNRSSDGVPRYKVRENPLPIFRQLARMALRQPEDWCRTREEFDKWSANHLRRSSSQVFLGVETCARNCFEIAKQKQMTTVLDCPQVYPTFLERLLSHAADDLGLAQPGPLDVPTMAARKRDEFAMADQLIMLSEVERRSFIEAGFEASRLVMTTLWADPVQWFPPPQERLLAPSRALKALFVGRIELRKGVPYLLKAARECGAQVELTIVGPDSGEVAPFLTEFEPDFTLVLPQNKERLREMYWEADVLVLPSLVETYGFVAMEAMACGTPVIVSDNCGVPVPDEAWRVPIMCSAAISERLMHYVCDRDLCREDGRRAADFARQWTPQAYRSQIGGILRSLLA